MTLACPDGKGMVGLLYSSSLTDSGGVPPYTFSITQGALPAGLALNSSAGAISGRPTAAGSYNFTAKVVDSKADSTTVTCGIIVGPPNHVTQITATIQPSPCLTVRNNANLPATAQQTVPGPITFQSTQATRNFNAPTTLVMLEGSAASVALKATKENPEGNVLFFVERAADDNPAIGGADEPPTLKPSGTDAATLGANQVGSFSVGAYVDVNNNGRMDPDEPPIYLNYVLAGLLRDAAINHNKPVVDSVEAHQTIAIARALNHAGTWTLMRVRSGDFDIENPNENAVYLNATVDLVGGGPDGRRGLDRVFGGWVQNKLSQNYQGFYADNHVTKGVSASNPPNNPPGCAAPRNTCIFTPGSPAPVLVDPPFLDSGRDNAGTGGNTSTLGTSRIRSRTPLARGSRIAIDAVDSPGRSYARFDPGFPASSLRSVDYGLNFITYLAFWTNATANIGATGDAADRLYSIGHIAPWSIRGSWSISPEGAATVTGARPAVRADGGSSQEGELKQAASRMEVCAPSGLRLLALDARN
jgi:hypothetical protein